MEYRQCKVRKRGTDIYTYMWIETAVAQVHRLLAIRDEAGWIIDKVWQATQSEEELVSRARDYQV